MATVAHLQDGRSVDLHLPVVVRIGIEADEPNVDAVGPFQALDDLVFRGAVGKSRWSVRPEVVALELVRGPLPPVRSVPLGGALE